MAVMKLQMNTPVEITRDLKVEVTDLVTNRVTTTTPNLDGTVNVRNLSPGQYRVKVAHANLPFAVIDQPVRVLTRPTTLIPIKIDLAIFENTPVRDIAEADLSPIQKTLEEAQDQAAKQNAKKGGEPIYAEDWNTLADTVGDIADATMELSRRVSPTGHDHPELIEKLDEIQRNLERFFDVFGRSMAQVQRQLQVLALRERTEQAMNDAGASTEAKAELAGIISTLDDVRNDSSLVYMNRLKKVGEQLEVKMTEIVAAAPPEAEQKASVVEAIGAVRTMGAAKPASSVEEEVRQHLKVDAVGSGNFGKAVGAARR